MTARRARRALRPAVRYAAQRMAFVLVFVIILFAAAGRLAWGGGWVYVLYGAFLEAGTLLVLAKCAPETLDHRGSWRRGVKPFDRLFAVAWLVVGLDARSRSAPGPVAPLVVGLVLLTLSTVFSVWAMLENEHFEQFVRIQEERAHRVVSSGPYRVVRHPGYAGAIVGALSVPLILGSWWAAAPAGGVALLFVIRTALEDRTLRRELAGYEAYTRQTRYRLLPGLW